MKNKNSLLQRLLNWTKPEKTDNQQLKENNQIFRKSYENRHSISNNKRKGLLGKAQNYQKENVSSSTITQEPDIDFSDENFADLERSSGYGYQPVSGIEISKPFSTYNEEELTRKVIPPEEKAKVKESEEDFSDEQPETQKKRKRKKRTSKKDIITHKAHEIISKNSPYSHYFRTLLNAERFLAEKEYDMSLEMYEKLIQKIPNKSIIDKLEQNIEDIEDFLDEGADSENEEGENKIIVQLKYPEEEKPKPESPEQKPSPSPKPFANTIIELIKTPDKIPSKASESQELKETQKNEFARPIDESQPAQDSQKDSSEKTDKPLEPEAKLEKNDANDFAKPIDEFQKDEDSKNTIPKDTAGPFAPESKEEEKTEELKSIVSEKPEEKQPDEKPENVIKKIFNQISEGIFQIQKAAFETENIEVKSENIQISGEPKSKEEKPELPEPEDTAKPETEEEKEEKPELPEPEDTAKPETEEEKEEKPELPEPEDTAKPETEEEKEEKPELPEPEDTAKPETQEEKEEQPETPELEDTAKPETQEEKEEQPETPELEDTAKSETQEEKEETTEIPDTKDISEKNHIPSHMPEPFTAQEPYYPQDIPDTPDIMPPMTGRTEGVLEEPDMIPEIGHEPEPSIPPAEEEKSNVQEIRGVLELKPPDQEDMPFLTLTYDFTRIPYKSVLSKDHNILEYAYYKYKPMLVKAHSFLKRKQITQALNYYRVIREQNIPREFKRMIDRNIQDITEYLEKYLMSIQE
ncbi:MAG: hypothetical protein OEZ22_08305 [Spirochaetia bacterium]|nr:hypothetical protein [Spirochaetia bacterium]